MFKVLNADGSVKSVGATGATGATGAAGAAGAGDVNGPADSVASEAALFDGVTGKLLKRATGTGVVHRTSGVDSVSAVVEADLTLADNTTADVSTTTHGFAPKAPGDATKFLNGANPPAWAVPAGGGGGGALVLLEQHTASNSATLDFTTAISATYDEYVIEILNILPASTADLWMRCSIDGGATYDATAGNYHVSYKYNSTGGTTIAAAASKTDPFIILAGSTVSATASAGGVRGTFRFFDPLNASIEKGIIGETTFMLDAAPNNRYQLNVAGYYVVVTPVNAIRFLMSTGNIASGTIRVYGIAKA